MNRDELRELSKEELVELVLKLQRPAKTSRTSSRPPSTDRKAKRAASKPGGAKPGHKGHFRSLAGDSDDVVEHRPDRCSGCGQFAPDAPDEVIGGHDSVELPPTLPVATRHQHLACACPGCGARVKADPPVAGSPFGPNIQVLALYLKHVQHVSYQRLQAMFGDVFGLTISQGALGNMFRRAQAAFGARKAGILARLRTADAMASDETGVRIEGVNAQHWVFRAPD